MEFLKKKCQNKENEKFGRSKTKKKTNDVHKPENLQERVFYTRNFSRMVPGPGEGVFGGGKGWIFRGRGGESYNLAREMLRMYRVPSKKDPILTIGLDCIGFLQPQEYVQPFQDVSGVLFCNTNHPN